MDESPSYSCGNARFSRSKKREQPIFHSRFAFRILDSILSKISLLFRKASNKEQKIFEWRRSDAVDGKVRYSSRGKKPSIVYNAVYMANTEWMDGSMTFHFSTPAEVFIDGEKVLTLRSL